MTETVKSIDMLDDAAAGSGYFLPYQLKWIQDESPLKIYEKSRRIGITYGTSYRCVRKCLRQPGNSKFVQWVSSRDDLLAREFITDYVAMWAKAANVVAKGLQGDWIEEVVDEGKGIKTFVVEFSNGSRIVSLSSNPKAFAGKGGDILLDEFDLHGHQDQLYDMAYPCTTWGGQLEIVSAYDSEGSEHTVFAQLIKDTRDLGNPNGFSLHSTTLTDAVEQGFVEKVNEVKARNNKPPQTRKEFVAQLKKGCRTHTAYLSQYECIPNSAAGGQAVRPNDLTNAKKNINILRLHLIGDAAVSDVTDPSCDPYIDKDFWRDAFPDSGRYSLGYDVARSKDLAAIWVNIEVHKLYTLGAVVTFENCKFESQKLMMDNMMDVLNAVGAGDSTGMGGPNCEYLETKYPDRFAPVNFASLKTTLATMMIEVYEQGRQIIPLNPADIGADVACVRRDVSPSGRLIFTVSSNPLLPDSHGDIAWSNALALFAGETLDKLGPCRMEPAGTGEDQRSDNWMRPGRQTDQPKKWGY